MTPATASQQQQQQKQPQPDQQIPSVQQIQWFYLDPQRNEQVLFSLITTEKLTRNLNYD